jgi:hypothetical protein
MNELNGRFWMVFNDSVTGRAPTWKHPTKEAAQQEAERLAALNPGIRFWVLEAQGFMRVSRPSTWTPAEDGMPF